MDSLHSAKEPVRLAVRPNFLDPYDAGDRAALVRAELAAHLRRPDIKYDGHDIGLFDASRGDGDGEEEDEEEDDLYQNTGVQGLPVTLPAAFQQERRISINEEALQDLAHLPRELLAGRNISSRRSSHSERRSSVMSIMTCNGWDSAELGAWARSPSRGNRSHRPSLAQSMFAEDLVEEDSEADKVGKNPSVASWVTYQGDTSQDLHSVRLMMMASALEDARNGMPYTAARGSDAGARVPPAGPAPPVVPRMGGHLSSSAAQHASVAATPPATSSWSHAYPGAAAAGPPPFYPSMHGVAAAAPPASPYCASAGWQPGYYGGGACWPPAASQLPMHAYGHGHGVKQHPWQAGGCAGDGAWGQPGDASRTGYPLAPPLPHGGAPGYHEPAMARTTVMLRNMPEGFTRDNLTGMLDSAGFAGRYDFVYMPMNFRTKASFGYAFVNMVSPDDAQRCHDTFQGFTGWGVLTDKVCEVSWSDMHQGLAAHIDRYRNSPVMHESVPDEYKPVMFHGGKRVAFPPPTKKLRQPRIRRSAEDGDEDELEDGLPAAPAFSEAGLSGSKAAAWLSPLPPSHLPRGPR